MKKIKIKYLAGILSAAAAVLIALYAPSAASAAKDALILCGSVLIPSLLPFFVCSYILINSGIAHRLSRALGFIMKPLFCINGSGAVALVTGLISGYPMGAAITGRLYEAGCIDKNEAERLLCFTNNSGPLFIIGAVGAGIYHSREAGFVLLAAHIAAALTVGFIMRFFGTPSHTIKKPAHQNKSLLSAFPDAVMSILSLCGFVIFFAVILSVLKDIGFIQLLTKIILSFKIEQSTAALISQGIFEITTAISNAKSGFLPAVSCVLAWGGMSVLLQTASIARGAGLSVKKYVFAKLLSGGIAAFYTKLLLYLVPVNITVFAGMSEAIQKTGIFLYYLIGSFIFAVSIYACFSFISLICRGNRH